MVTFGDATTLLLTFFVMLHATSGLEEEEFERFMQGLRAGFDSFGIHRARRGTDSLTEAEQRLLESTMDTAGTKLPEKYARLAMAEMRKFHEDIDIDELPDDLEAILVRLPVELLFDEQGQLTAEGEEILKKNAEITRANRYSIAVRVRSERRNTELGLKIIEYLKKHVTPDTRDVGLTNDFEPAKPLREGECMILLLEV